MAQRRTAQWQRWTGEQPNNPDAPKRDGPPACIEGHAHYWDLTPPNGPTCVGVCRYCHARQVYLTSDPFYVYNDDFEGVDALLELEEEMLV